MGVSLESGINLAGLWLSSFRASCSQSIVKHSISAPQGRAGEGVMTTSVPAEVGIPLESGITSGGDAYHCSEHHVHQSIVKHSISAPQGRASEGVMTTSVPAEVGIPLESGITSGGDAYHCSEHHVHQSIVKHSISAP